MVNKQHGGAGRGQGRHKLSDEPTVRISATVPASYKEYVKLVGKGDYAKGIRLVIEYHRQHTTAI